MNRVPEHHHFIGCDWGTTSFRLRCIEFGTRRIVAEQAEPGGIKAFAALQPADRAAAMASFLAERLERWPGLSTALPIVISGMASSTIGWTELPYARTPFSLDGADCQLAQVEFAMTKSRKRTATLVSGVRSDDDVLRGEECVLLGVHALRPADSDGRTLALLAGTHPKHAVLERGRLVSFRTHLTGELFETVGTATVLAASIDRNTANGTPDFTAFREGIAWVRDEGLTAGLFQVRVRQVLHQVARPKNTWFLSGLMVGAELERLARDPMPSSVLLVGDDLRVALYQEALRELGIAREPVPALDLATTVIAGQEVIARRHRL